jgi:ectoine hydroxylase-related dioxygenase (phytanoyl-CoA dioxygenase family)
MILKSQIEFWNSNGYVLCQSIFPKEQIDLIVKYSDEVIAFPETTGKWMKYYEKSILTGESILGRIEYFLDYHPEFSRFLEENQILNSTLGDLFGESPILFKEKINMKLHGSNGYSPHQDAPAWINFPPKDFITAFIAIDECTVDNGCMEMSSKNKLNNIVDEKDIPDLQFDWQAVSMNPGDVLFFDSYIFHKSNPNTSNLPRRAILATYNKAMEGSFRNNYFELKRKYFPPENERLSEVNYTDNPFNHYNPFK